MTLNLGKIGITNKGDHVDGATYKKLELVKKGTVTYMCNATSTTQTPPHGDWLVFVEGGLVDRGNHIPGTKYLKQEFVKRGVVTYMCSVASTLNTPPHADWSVLIHGGIEDRGEWVEGTYYKQQTVKRGAIRYICVADMTTQNLSSSDWEVYTKGIENRGQWEAGTYYDQEFVKRGVVTYICNKKSTTQTPTPTASDWDVFVEGDLNNALNKFDEILGSIAKNRYDKRLGSLDITDTVVEANKKSFLHTGDNGTDLFYRDVLHYTNNVLTHVEHFYGTANLNTPSGTTTITREDGKFKSSTYTE